MKRGQVTVFVLLGILLLIVVGFAIYTMVVTSDERAVTADDITSEDEAVNQLNQYLQSCVESSVANGTQTVLLQGGVYYEEQNGTANSTYSTEHSPSFTQRFYDVYHGIRDSYPCPLASENPPRYPANSTFFNNYDDYGTGSACIIASSTFETNTILQSAGYLGVATMSRSCRLNSQNRIDNQQSPFVGSRCGATTPNPSNALETHIEDATETVLQRCADNQTVTNRTGNTVELFGDPNVSVGYAPETTSYRVRMPIRIDVAGGEPTVTRHTFTYQANIPLLSMWRKIYDAVLTDAKEPRHNFTESLTSLDIQATNDTAKPRIYAITHPSAQLNGEDLTVMTAFERRAPVLNLIDQTTEDELNVIVEATNDIQLSPEAVDPDDQFKPNISYARFGEDYTASDDNGRAAPTDSVTNVASSQGPAVSSSNTLTARNGTHTIKDPYTWGVYETRVNASIPGDENDWQDVTTLVVDKPRLTINISTPENKSYIVAEAPFTINGSSSQPPKAFGYKPFFNTNWTIGDQDVNTNMSGFTLSDLTTYNVTDIDDQIAALGITKPQTNITLTSSADTTYRDNVRHSVLNETTVKLCEPNNAESGEAYPYNESPTYNTDNPCCQPPTPTNTISDSSAPPCLEETKLGNASDVKPWFNDLADETREYTDNAFTTQVNSDLTSASNELNDFDSDTEILVNFNRSCSGERGNICGGPVSIGITNVSSP
jgi:hypothetical protein